MNHMIDVCTYTVLLVNIIDVITMLTSNGTQETGYTQGVVAQHINNLMIYLASFDTESQALEYCDTLINGGVVQQQHNTGRVWQLVSMC